MAKPRPPKVLNAIIQQQATARIELAAREDTFLPLSCLDAAERAAAEVLIEDRQRRRMGLAPRCD